MNNDNNLKIAQRDFNCRAGYATGHVGIGVKAVVVEA